jgi:hypothetical protein
VSTDPSAPRPAPAPQYPNVSASSTSRAGPVPPLLAGLFDDAAVFPPGSATVPDAVAAHRSHRRAWYAPLVGPLLVPPSDVDALARLLGADERLEIGVVGEFAAVVTTVGHLARQANPVLVLRHVESPVAKRGEDPLPGLRALVGSGLPGYAEIPLTAGLLTALDEVARSRAAGMRLAPKFRTGGLVAELFPTPLELAGIICACRDRALPFKLTAGLHHAVRRVDPQTGFTHHGFLNVLVAAAVAAEGAEPAAVAEILAGTEPGPLVSATVARLANERPLWIGFGTCSITEPLDDLRRLGLLPPADPAPVGRPGGGVTG